MENNICNSMILTSGRRHFYLVGQSKHKPDGHGYEIVSSVRALVPERFSVEEELMHVKHVEIKSPHVGVMWKFGRGVISSAIQSPTNYEITEVSDNLPAIWGVDTDSELKQERDQLKVERDRLKEENDQLMTERNQLKDEKFQIWNEKDRLKENRDTFFKENELLRNENDVLKAEKNQLSKGNQRLRDENNILKKERDPCQQCWTELEYELKQEKNANRPNIAIH
ncbi:hypothetical protein TNCV_1420581 [Trichonephila clavipes]|nr:hypothetical protein TNCV_1420581 [Trichonephila clavipes]